MEKITQDSIIQRNDKRVVSTRLGDEMVMMDIEKGNYINLNRTALVIWEQISNPLSVSKLITYLVDRFDIEYTLCRDETLCCLNEMYIQELVLIKSEG